MRRMFSSPDVGRYNHENKPKIQEIKQEPNNPVIRPDKDTYFFNVAKVVATRSTCLHRHVGAILVVDGQIIATGFNGAPVGEPHCIDIGCSKPRHAIQFEDCKAVHAEINAIIQAAIHGTSIRGATLYCTHSPCVMCQRVLKNAGITNIKFLENYP